MVASDGGIFSFGSAGFHGSAAGVATSPIVGMSSSISGGGYWMVTENGTVYAYGDAALHGSVSNPSSPIVGIAETSDAGGYWLTSADGAVYAFGDAGYMGSMAGVVLSKPIVGVAGAASRT